MNAVFTLAVKEFRDGLRNRWFLGATGALALFAICLIFLGSAPTGTVGVDPISIMVVSLASLTVFLMPLMGLMLSYDSIVGELERGTLTLLLTYPVTRWQVVLGKFLGHSLGLGCATIIGYGIAGAVLAALAPQSGDWAPFVFLIFTSILLGGCFVAVGLLISVLPRLRAAAAGMAFAVWLILVVLYDLAMLGSLVAGGSEVISKSLFNFLLLANPADAFRLMNLVGFEDIRGLAGLSSTEIGLANAEILSFLSLGVWMIIPLIAAVVFFRRKPV